MLIRRGLMAGDRVKPVTWKTYIDTDVTDSDYKACKIPIVDEGYYYIYLQLSSPCTNATLFNLFIGSILNTYRMVTIEIYASSLWLYFPGGFAETRKALSSSSGDYPYTVICTLRFSYGKVSGVISDAYGNDLSNVYELARDFETPSEFGIYRVVDKSYVNKLMIRAFDNA